MNDDASERKTGKRDLEGFGAAVACIFQILLLPVREILAAFRGDERKQDPPKGTS